MMRVIDKIDVMDRRRFLGRSVGTAALLAAVPVLPGRAYAAVTLKTGPASSVSTLVKMARDLYPHDRLPDAAYETAVGFIDGQLADNAAKKVTMAQGVKLLDAAAVKLKGKPYLAIDKEDDRVAVLRSIEGTEFFKAMRSGMITGLYNQDDIWMKFGYEGSSAEKGGYLHRGFNDLDWLPA
ncbi:gluconate 2-dehydrogenase subunit 3 family protein [Sphingomonas sp. M1A8_2b]